MNGKQLICDACLEAEKTSNLHPKFHGKGVCSHVLKAMSGEELRAMLPGAESAVREIVRITNKHTTQPEALQSNG